MEPIINFIQLKEAAQRWNSRAEQYGNENNLDSCIDLFITRFIVFSIFANEIKN